MRVVLARCFYDWAGAPAAFRERPIEAATRFAALHKRWADHDGAATILKSRAPAFVRI